MFTFLLLSQGVQAAIDIPLQAKLVRSPLRDAVVNDLDEVSFTYDFLVNNLNMEYSASLSVGTPAQPMEFALDLSASELIVPWSFCDCHAKNRYYPLWSSTFKNQSEPTSFSYRNVVLKGYIAKDTVSFGISKSLDQEFVVDTYDRGLSWLSSDGILGLGFSWNGKKKYSFIHRLSQRGEISKAIFSIYLANVDHTYYTSILSIGEWYPNTYGYGSTYTVNVEKGSDGWLTKITDFSVDYVSTSPSRDYAIFDALNPFFMIPTSSFKKFRAAAHKKNWCYDDSTGLIYCSCAKGKYTSYPDLSFTLDRQTLTVHAENYILYHKGFCYLSVFPSAYNRFTIGQPFFREHYSMFDLDNHQVKFLKAARASYSYNSFYTVVQNGLIGLSVVGLVAGGITMWKRKKNEDLYSRII